MDAQKVHKAAGLAAAKRQAKARGKGNQPLMLGVLVMVSGYLWLGQPKFLEPVPLEPISVELADASLRFAMAIWVTKISQFQAANERLPNSLAETGEDPAGFSYQVQSGTYTLTGTQGEVTLDYVSTDDISLFLGNSAQIIQEGTG